jgi:hypothetical protein
MTFIGKIIFITCFVGSVFNTLAQDIRIIQTINSDWAFNYFPSGKEDSERAMPVFDDSQWSAVALPHTWQTYETTGEIHPFIATATERVDSYWWYGWGWYRKRISFSESLKNKKITVEFDGVQKYSKVYINGHYLGEHKGGYSGFCFDITDYIHFGKENILAVAVSNRRDDTFGVIPPSTAGNYNVYGGIYRDVRIVVKNEVNIPYQGSADYEGGTFVTTPSVSETEGIARIITYVRNESKKQQNITVKSIITDADCKALTSMEQTIKIASGELKAFDQVSSGITNPKLWSPDSPYLYHVYTEVYADGKLSDTCHSPLGFRYFHWDYTDNTLYINGKQIHIHGTNRHQEYPWLGDAIPKWITEMDMHDIRYGLNHNFMRAGQYPCDPFLYDYTDRHGIVIVMEVPNIKDIRFGMDIQEQHVREMVRRFRNHPSVFFWSVGNETAFAADSKWVWEEDTTRIIHERKTKGYGDYVTHSARNLDMENLLRVTVRGWYNRDVRDLEPGRDEPLSPENSGQMAGTETWQHRMARVDNGSIRGRIDKNMVAWLYEDHGADRIYKNAPLKYVNAKGWVDMYRVPKYLYYLWQANYLEEPMVFIQPHFWRKHYVGQHKDFQVDSNCDEVELFVNERSVGKAQPSKDNFFTLEFADILVEEGAIKAIGRKGNKEVSCEVKMAGKPTKIILKTSHLQIPADRSGLAIVTADITDAKGIHVYGANPALKWEISGEGTLVGPSVYETDTDKNSANEGSGYIDTPVANIVRSTNKPGKITVSVSAEGLTSAEIEIQTFPVIHVANGIVESPLPDAGRLKVQREINFREQVEYIEEIKPIISPYHINAFSTEDYERQIRNFVQTRNPVVDRNTIEFEKLIRRLTAYIENTNGELTEDDYNFIVRQYNDSRMLARLVETRGFPAEYVNTLRDYYSGMLLLESKQIDMSMELNRINNIPKHLHLIKILPTNGNDPCPVNYEYVGSYYWTCSKSLEKIIAAFYPDYSGWSQQQKNDFSDNIYQINPNINKSGEEYILMENTPIVIPASYKQRESISSTEKPWTYWWWMGSSVTEEGIGKITTLLLKWQNAKIYPVIYEKENSFSLQLIAFLLQNQNLE